MQLNLMTWPEVEAQLQDRVCVMLPMGSVEQHGPMGLIGTDVICASEVAMRAAEQANAIVAPSISYTPAPFNTDFPGTVSISNELATELLKQVCEGLLDQGFIGVFIVNGHGANLALVQAVQKALPKGVVTVKSWWDPEEVGQLRRDLYGDWEGMHATPSEVAITQALYGAKPQGPAKLPPKKLSAQYIRDHSGDRHGPPKEHRALFPDGRVGSHSALAAPQHGQQLLDVASSAIAGAFRAFSDSRQAATA